MVFLMCCIIIHHLLFKTAHWQRRNRNMCGHVETCVDFRLSGVLGTFEVAWGILRTFSYSATELRTNFHFEIFRTTPNNGWAVVIS